MNVFEGAGQKMKSGGGAALKKLMFKPKNDRTETSRLFRAETSSQIRSQQNFFNKCVGAETLL